MQNNINNMSLRIIMGWVRQLMIIILVAITIYSTLLFYFLMTVPADSRLQEIDYLQRSKFMGDRVLYMDKIMHLNDRFHYFTISLLRFRKAKPTHCKRQYPEKALLIVSASPFDMISLYAKLLRELEADHDQCTMPEVFVFKKTHPLILSTEENINKFAFQIGEIIKYITLEGKYDLSIFTHQEGAILTLAYFTRRTITVLFNSIMQKISSLVLVDIAHPFMRVQFDPPFRMLNKLKKEIVTSKERIDIFNKLRIVIITTYKEDNHEWRFTFPIGQQYYVFNQTVLISTKEMANVHYYLSPNSLSFPPLVRRIGHFFSKSFTKNMTNNQIRNFFRQGESYSYETIQEKEVKNCIRISYYTQDIILINSACIQLGAIQLNDTQIMLVYSPNHFEMYSSDLKKIYPFDNLTQGSIYVLSQIQRCAYIINHEEVDIYLTVKPIVTPSKPLLIPQQQIFAASQLMFSDNYSIINICPNILLLFPMHFPQGINKRKFLVEGNGEDCFIETSLVDEYSSQFFSHFSLVRNLIIFTLLCSVYRKQNLSERLTQQILINFLLILWRQSISSKILYGLYIISFALIIQYLEKLILCLSSKLIIHRKWGNALLLINAAICFIGLVFDLFNVWGWFLLSTMGFINNQNLVIMIIKLYFLKQDIWNSNTNGITQLGLVTMWLYTTSSSNKNLSTSFWTPQRVFTGLLLIGVAFSVESSGQFIDNLMTIFMKVLIVVKMFRIVRK